MLQSGIELERNEGEESETRSSSIGAMARGSDGNRGRSKRGGVAPRPEGAGAQTAAAAETERSFRKIIWHKGLRMLRAVLDEGQSLSDQSQSEISVDNGHVAA